MVNIQRLQKSLLEFSKEVQIHENKSCSNNLLQNEKFCSPTVLQKEKIRTFVSRSAWSGLCKALHLFKTKQNDWLVIVPDSLMVLMENLKLFVKDLNCEENYYYGYALEHYEADYNALGAGILLSRGTIRKLFEKFQTENDCDNSGKHWRNEDVFLGEL